MMLFHVSRIVPLRLVPVAASALAWSYFYKAYGTPDAKIPASTINLEIPQIDQRLKEIEERLSKIEIAVIKEKNKSLRSIWGLLPRRNRSKYLDYSTSTPHPK